MDFYKKYLEKIKIASSSIDENLIFLLSNKIKNCWDNNRQVFFCGNGGSAGNANHLVNDFYYGVIRKKGKGIRAISLCANTPLITCLANDTGYENIFSEQIANQGNPGDLLIVLSGSGNSKNIINVILEAKNKKITTAGIIGYDGGKAKEIIDICIHVQIQDMQISEDFQLIIGHMIMQHLSKMI